MPKIVKLARRASAYSSTFALEDIDIAFADGSVLRLVAKDLSRPPSDEHARPDFLYEPGRELDIYRRILPHAPSGTARWYGDFGGANRPRRLVLERVDGLQLSDVGALSIWKRTAQWIGQFHTSFPPHTIAQLKKTSQLLVYDAAFYWRWLERARRFATGPAVRRVIDRIAKGYARVVTRLIRVPGTLIHGDFYPCNVVIGKTDGDVRVCPVDWEMAAIGPGLIDLASLTTGLGGREQRALLRAYRAATSDSTPTSARVPDEWMVDLDCCRLHLAVRMLGWSPTWTPSPQHARNWLGEAERLAGRLGL